MAEPDMDEINRQARVNAAGSDPKSKGALRDAEIMVWKDWLIEQDATNHSSMPPSARLAHEKAVGEYHMAILEALKKPGLITNLKDMNGSDPTAPEIVTAAQKAAEEAKTRGR